MKTTPSQFIRDRRMELAAKSLRIERHRIADIAYDLGYSDLSLFSRHFKAHFKVAPRDYRRNHA
jgi:AraC-like DNA-binding protein